MRVTQFNYYNRFINDQQGIKQQLENLSRQISSGKKIKNGFEDPQIFADTLRLDYEETTLTQAIDVSKDAQNFANNTDSVMFQFTDGLTRFKTLLVQAATDSNSDANYYAISNELKSLKEHFINLGNSSINGRFLFSGNKLDVKPLDDEGNYYGNNEEIKAVVGAGVEVPYNIPGEELFYGEDDNINRTVTTNVALTTQEGKLAGLETTLQEITGSANDFTFTIQGRKSSGEYFSQDTTLAPSATVQDLLDAIETAYDSPVDVQLINGYIQVRDKKEGRSLLDFHIYGTDGTNELELVKSPEVNNASTYDGTPFAEVAANTFLGNVPQIVLSDNSFAKSATKVQDTIKTDLSTNPFTLRISANGTELAQTISVNENTTFQQILDDKDNTDIDSIKEILENNGYSNVEVKLDRNGRLKVKADNLTSFQIYEDTDPSTVPNIVFNANDALTVDDPKHDFFAAVDQAIEAVEYGLNRPDGNNALLARNPGIQNAMTRIQHVLEHVGKEHTKVGAMSNSLRYAVERSETIKINVQTLRSEVLDTDIGEATMKLNQLSLNFQALMASVSKVQNLSLVNYM